MKTAIATALLATALLGGCDTVRHPYILACDRVLANDPAGLTENGRRCKTGEPQQLTTSDAWSYALDHDAFDTDLPIPMPKDVGKISNARAPEPSTP